MTVVPPAVAQTPATQPRLIFFTSAVSGHCRRVEGFLAQVLQRRRNHGTFRVVTVQAEERPELVARFGITELPTLVVVKDRVVRARVVQPRGCKEIEHLLRPWLQ